MSIKLGCLDYKTGLLIEWEQATGCFFGGGSPSGNTTTTQTNTPWAGQEAFLSGSANPNLPGSSSPTGVFQSAAQLYNNPSSYPQLYPGATSGSLTSPFTALQNQSLDQAGNIGLNSPLMNTDSTQLQNIINGSNLSAGNPYQTAELQNLNSQITPQLESQFTQGNAMNNPAAAFATAQGMGAADSSILGQNYNAGLTQQTSAMDQGAPLAYSQQLGGLSTAENAGQTQQTQAQDVLNGITNSYDYYQQLPYQMLQNYAGLVNGNYGGTTTSTQPYYNNTGSQLLQSGTQLGSMALTLAMMA